MTLGADQSFRGIRRPTRRFEPVQMQKTAEHTDLAQKRPAARWLDQLTTKNQFVSMGSQRP